MSPYSDLGEEKIQSLFEADLDLQKLFVLHSTSRHEITQCDTAIKWHNKVAISLFLCKVFVKAWGCQMTNDTKFLKTTIQQC